MKGIKTKAKTLSLRSDIIQKIEEHAKDQNRSASNLVETILIDYFKKLEALK